MYTYMYIHIHTVELGYNVIKGTEYFVPFKTIVVITEFCYNRRLYCCGQLLGINW